MSVSRLSALFQHYEPISPPPDSIPIQTALAPPDQPFLSRIKDAIESRLDDNNLCSGNLHQFVPTSRATLHRFLHKCTGGSTSDYLNCYRVQRSLSYLNCPNCSISNVAAHVGMNVSAYTRAFKTVFGQTPSAYRRMKK